MINRDNNGRSIRTLKALLMAGVVGVGSMALVGCSGGDDDEEQVMAPPPPKRVNPLEDLDLAYGVQFPEENAPSTRALAEAVATLASALIEGDHSSFETIVAKRDQLMLETLLATGGWEAETKDIEIVRVCVLNENEDNASCELGLGLQTPDGAYMLAWKGSDTGGEWEFTGLAIEPIEDEMVAMLDGRPLLPPYIPPAEVEAFVEIEGDGNDGIFGNSSGDGSSPSSPSSPSTPDSPFRKPNF